MQTRLGIVDHLSPFLAQVRETIERHGCSDLAKGFPTEPASVMETEVVGGFVTVEIHPSRELATWYAVLVMKLAEESRRRADASKAEKDPATLVETD